MSASVEPVVAETLAVAGERLCFSRSPGVGTPLVICNDFGANLEILDEFAVALDRPVLRFDPPGIGGSADVVVMRRMPALARLLLGMLDELGLGEPVDMLGIGWGGLLAQQFARDHGAQIRRLILAATSSGQLMLPGRMASLFRLVRPNGLLQTALTARQARTVFGGRRHDECRAITRGMARATPPTRRGHAAQLYALAGFSSLTWLHRLDITTLILAGDDDAVVPMVNTRVLASLLPRARLVVMPGGGHWFLLERAGDVARLVDGFVAARVAVTGNDDLPANRIR